MKIIFYTVCLYLKSSFKKEKHIWYGDHFCDTCNEDKIILRKLQHFLKLFT